MLFDPMSANLPSGVTLELGRDRRVPNIRSLVMDHSSAFVFMVDGGNNSIIVVSLESGQLVSTLPLDVAPWSAALIGEKELVVTAPDDKVMILVDITDKSKLLVKETIMTGRKYRSVCVVPSTDGDVKLAVNCARDGDGPASIDIISVDGTFDTNIINSDELPKLIHPRFLCIHDNDLYISDYHSHCVFKVVLQGPDKGVVLNTLVHPYMRLLTQLCTDSAGHLYVASAGGQCVLVRSVDGRWRKLLTGEEHGEREGNYVCPLGLSVSATGLVVSWSNVNLFKTVVKKY